MAIRKNRPAPSGSRREIFIVSACLAGFNCKYSAGNNLNKKIRRQYRAGLCLALCPEVLGGLPTPRPRMEMSGGDGSDVLDGRARIFSIAGEDVTSKCEKGVREVLRVVKRYGIKRAVLKSKSPCCGAGKVYDGSFTGTLKDGDGLLAAALIRSGVKVIAV